MPLEFSQADSLFRKNDLRSLSEDSAGLRYLKLRSLNRSGHLEELFKAASIQRPEVGSRELFRIAFGSGISDSTIESFIRAVYKAEREERKRREADLLNQLYRVQEFDWGGLHQNSLERTIVDNYVKKIVNYDALCSSIDGELMKSMRGYVICSWYNHWTSIIIEDVFKDHPTVLPAIGLVKKIDFFIKEVPFDLKVTYLPEEFLSDSRKVAGHRPELTLLKQQARQNRVPIDVSLSHSALLQDLWAKVSDHPAPTCKALIEELTAFRNGLINSIERDPGELIQWLYEHQGERRFDAANRLFLVLVDQRNYFESWKLKRAKPLIEQKIGQYLDKCGSEPGRRIKFSWEDEEYSAVSDMIVVRQVPVAVSSRA